MTGPEGMTNDRATLIRQRDKAEAERDALIAYLTAWYAAYPEDSMWEALPEPLRQRIEQV